MKVVSILQVNLLNFKSANASVAFEVVGFDFKIDSCCKIESSVTGKQTKKRKLNFKFRIFGFVYLLAPKTLLCCLKMTS
jgi:hypothetical protein